MRNSIKAFTVIAASIATPIAAQDCGFQVPFSAKFYVVRPHGANFNVDYSGAVAFTVAWDVAHACTWSSFVDRFDSSGEAYAGPFNFISASAFSPDLDVIYCNYSAALARAGVFSNSCGVWIETERGRVSKYHFGSGEYCCAPGGAIAFSAAACEFEVDLAGTLVSEIEMTVDTSPEEGRRFAGVVNTAGTGPETLASLIQTTGGGDLGTGWSYNSGTSTWELADSSSVAANETVSLEVVAFQVEDKNLDVNLDGRPNAVDVTSLIAIVGTGSATDPDILALHDFNADGVITLDDVSYLETVLDSGADAGIYQDVDGDGNIDCDDLPSTIPSVGAVVSDADYIVEIDEDLDGVISLVERREFLLDLQPADSNLNGVQESTDWTAWLAAYNSSDLAADANRNGMLDSGDQTAWIAAYNSGGCP